MSLWIFVCGIPCVGKSTAIQDAATTYDIKADAQRYYVSPETPVEANTTFNSIKRNVWLLHKLAHMWKVHLEDVIAPKTRLFDGSPLCALINEQLRATLGLHRIQDSLSSQVIAECAAELFLPLAQAGIRIQLIIVGLNKPAFYLPIVKRMRHRGYDQRLCNENYLAVLDDLFQSFGRELRTLNPHPNVSVVLAMQHNYTFFHFSHLGGKSAKDQREEPAS